MVDFKAKLIDQEWKKLGVQLVNLVDSNVYQQADKHVCLHCNRESPIGVEGEKPLFMIHDDVCEVGKSQELIAKIRKRVKESKKK